MMRIDFSALRTFLSAGLFTSFFSFHLLAQPQHFAQRKSAIEASPISCSVSVHDAAIRSLYQRAYEEVAVTDVSQKQKELQNSGFEVVSPGIPSNTWFGDYRDVYGWSRAGMERVFHSALLCRIMEPVRQSFLETSLRSHIHLWRNRFPENSMERVWFDELERLLNAVKDIASRLSLREDTSVRDALIEQMRIHHAALQGANEKISPNLANKIGEIEKAVLNEKLNTLSDVQQVLASLLYGPQLQASGRSTMEALVGPVALFLAQKAIPQPEEAVNSNADPKEIAFPQNPITKAPTFRALTEELKKVIAGQGVPSDLTSLTNATEAAKNEIFKLPPQERSELYRGWLHDAASNIENRLRALPRDAQAERVRLAAALRAIENLEIPSESPELAVMHARETLHSERALERQLDRNTVNATRDLIQRASKELGVDIPSEQRQAFYGDPYTTEFFERVLAEIEAYHGKDSTVKKDAIDKMRKWALESFSMENAPWTLASNPLLRKAMVDILDAGIRGYLAEHPQTTDLKQNYSDSLIHALYSRNEKEIAERIKGRDMERLRAAVADALRSLQNPGKNKNITRQQTALVQMLALLDGVGRTEEDLRTSQFSLGYSYLNPYDFDHVVRSLELERNLANDYATLKNDHTLAAKEIERFRKLSRTPGQGVTPGMTSASRTSLRQTLSSPIHRKMLEHLEEMLDRRGWEDAFGNLLSDARPGNVERALMKWDRPYYDYLLKTQKSELIQEIISGPTSEERTEQILSTLVAMDIAQDIGATGQFWSPSSVKEFLTAQGAFEGVELEKKKREVFEDLAKQALQKRDEVSAKKWIAAIGESASLPEEILRRLKSEVSLDEKLSQPIQNFLSRSDGLPDIEDSHDIAKLRSEFEKKKTELDAQRVEWLMQLPAAQRWNVNKEMDQALATQESDLAHAWYELSDRARKQELARLNALRTEAKAALDRALQVLHLQKTMAKNQKISDSPALRAAKKEVEHQQALFDRVEYDFNEKDQLSRKNKGRERLDTLKKLDAKKYGADLAVDASKEALEQLQAELDSDSSILVGLDKKLEELEINQELQERDLNLGHQRTVDEKIQKLATEFVNQHLAEGARNGQAIATATRLIREQLEARSRSRAETKAKSQDFSRMNKILAELAKIGIVVKNGMLNFEKARLHQYALVEAWGEGASFEQMKEKLDALEPYGLAQVDAYKGETTSSPFQSLIRLVLSKWGENNGHSHFALNNETAVEVIPPEDWDAPGGNIQIRFGDLQMLKSHGNQLVQRLKELPQEFQQAAREHGSFTNAMVESAAVIFSAYGARGLLIDAKDYSFKGTRGFSPQSFQVPKTLATESFEKKEAAIFHGLTELEALGAIPVRNADGTEIAAADAAILLKRVVNPQAQEISAMGREAYHSSLNASSQFIIGSAATLPFEGVAAGMALIARGSAAVRAVGVGARLKGAFSYAGPPSLGLVTAQGLRNTSMAARYIHSAPMRSLRGMYEMGGLSAGPGALWNEGKRAWVYRRLPDDIKKDPTKLKEAMLPYERDWYNNFAAFRGGFLFGGAMGAGASLAQMARLHGAVGQAMGLYGSGVADRMLGDWADGKMSFGEVLKESGRDVQMLLLFMGIPWAGHAASKLPINETARWWGLYGSYILANNSVSWYMARQQNPENAPGFMEMMEHGLAGHLLFSYYMANHSQAVARAHDIVNNNMTLADAEKKWGDAGRDAYSLIDSRMLKKHFHFEESETGKGSRLETDIPVFFEDMAKQLHLTPESLGLVVGANELQGKNAFRKWWEDGKPIQQGYTKKFKDLGRIMRDGFAKNDGTMDAKTVRTVATLFGNEMQLGQLKFNKNEHIKFMEDYGRYSLPEKLCAGWGHDQYLHFDHQWVNWLHQQQAKGPRTGKLQMKKLLAEFLQQYEARGGALSPSASYLSLPSPN